MPINIYNEETKETIKFLCDESWSLPVQIYELEMWLNDNKNQVPKGNYVADVGFEIRKDASSGGAVLSKDSMKVMTDIGIDLYLSEYRR